jgi:hypothetical protein
LVVWSVDQWESYRTRDTTRKKAVQCIASVSAVFPNEQH